MAAMAARDLADRLVTMSRNELDWIIQSGEPYTVDDLSEHVDVSRDLVVSLDEYRAAMEVDVDEP